MGAEKIRGYRYVGCFIDNRIFSDYLYLFYNDSRQAAPRVKIYLTYGDFIFQTIVLI